MVSIFHFKPGVVFVAESMITSSAWICKCQLSLVSHARPLYYTILYYIILHVLGSLAHARLCTRIFAIDREIEKGYPLILIICARFFFWGGGVGGDVSCATVATAALSLLS